MSAAGILLSLSLPLALACRASRPAPEVARETRVLAPAARKVALALADSAVRARLRHALRLTQTFPLPASFRAGPTLVARVPWGPHWDQWSSDPDTPLLVAVGDQGIPIAFDVRGGRHRLDPFHPPHTTVLLLRRPGTTCAGSWLCGRLAE